MRVNQHDQEPVFRKEPMTRLRNAFACMFVFAVIAPSWAQDAAITPVAVSLPARTLAEYAGTYHQVDEPEVRRVFYVEHGHLFTEGDRLRKDQLEAASTDHLFAVGHDLKVNFERDANGRITGAVANDKTLVRDSDSTTRLNHFRDYVRHEVMIPARDGVKLHAVIFTPVDWDGSREKLPFLMARTPYGVNAYTSGEVNEMKPELARSGYIFVFGDIRGRYQSEGQFVMNRPIVAHTTKADVDETTDTRDTIDWLLKNVPNNNGRVGVIGVSYPGFLAMMAGIDAHPAVKAISPQAPMTNIWKGDDFFHNGAFRETYGFDYVQELEGQKTDVLPNSTEDTFNYFLRNTNFSNAAAEAKMSNLPTARIFLNEPEYSKFWQAMAVETHLTKVEVPTLEVGGWWDQEDMWGTQAEYAALKPHDSRHEVFLVLGPWNHGGWAATTRHLGPIDFGAPTGDEYRKTIEAPFFEKYLKDEAGVLPAGHGKLPDGRE